MGLGKTVKHSRPSDEKNRSGVVSGKFVSVVVAVAMFLVPTVATR